MECSKIINYIEDKETKINDNWYYHAFNYDNRINFFDEYNQRNIHEDFIDMLDNGIKAPILTKRNSGYFNGNFYISLSKKKECENSAYDRFIYSPMFIISEELKTIHAKHYYQSYRHSPEWINQTFLPLRKSCYENEYQKLLFIPPKYLLGIQYSLSLKCTYREQFERKFLSLIQLIEDLEKANSQLPIIDGSSNRLINKQKVLSLK